MFTVKEWLQLLNPVDIHHGGTMHANKFSRIELALHCRQSLAHHSRGFAGMEMKVFVVRFYPIDLADVQEGDPSIRPDDDAIQILLLSPNTLEKRSYLEMLG